MVLLLCHSMMRTSLGMVGAFLEGRSSDIDSFLEAETARDTDNNDFVARTPTAWCHCYCNNRIRVDV